MNKDLYIELLEAEVKRGRMQVQSLEMRLQQQYAMRNEKASEGSVMRRQGAVVSGMMGVTPSKAAEAIAEQEMNYKPPRNLGDGPVDLMAKTRADLKSDDDIRESDDAD